MNSNTKIHPSDPNYNAALRDAVMDMAPFYDPNHRCGIVRDKIFHGCLEELREREKLTRKKLDELKVFIRDHVLSEIYYEPEQNAQIIETLRAMVFEHSPTLKS